MSSKELEETESDTDSDTEYGHIGQNSNAWDGDTDFQKHVFATLNLVQNGKDVVLGAGDYFVGDISPMLEDGDKSELMSLYKNGHDGSIQLRDKFTVVLWATLDTRGMHFDDANRQYILGSYFIGIFRLPPKPQLGAEQWQVEYYDEVMAKTRYGQVIHYEKDFSCSCYDGKIPLAKSGEFDKTRILHFGEKVEFILHQYRTCEGMILFSDQINKRRIWRNTTREKHGDILGNFGLFCAKVANAIGLDPNAMDEDKKENLFNMIEKEFSRYVETNKDKEPE